MPTVTSFKDGLDCLHSVLSTQLATLTAPLGYEPIVLWRISDQLDNPPNDKVWLLVANVVDSDSRANIGRPRRFEVFGTYNVILHFPQQATVFSPVEEASELIKMAFYDQNLLRPYNVLSATVNDVDPIEQWNRKQIAISYRFEYFN